MATRGCFKGRNKGNNYPLIVHRKCNNKTDIKMEPALRHSAWHRVLESSQGPYKATLLDSYSPSFFIKNIDKTNRRRNKSDMQISWARFW